MRAYYRFIICMIALFGAAAAASAPALDSVKLLNQRIDGASVSLITVDLNDPTLKVEIGLPERGLSHSEPFSSFIRRHQPIAAVTGTYFDLRTCLPVGSIVVGGKLVHESAIGTAVCFASDNRVSFIEARRGASCDLSGADCALRTGPRLLASGQYVLDPRREGFRHPGLFGARTRMALGVTLNNKLLLVYVRTPVTFARTARIMRLLGGTDAVCLDGGTSSAMYYRGRMVRQAGRTLTNVIEVVRRPVFVVSPATTLVRRPADHPGSGTLLERASGSRATDTYLGYRHAAVLGDSVRLRPTKRLASLFPVDRTKLSGSKRLENT